MNALINAEDRRGGTLPPSAGFASCVNPEANGSPAGVSVEYAPDSAKQWYVLRVSYGRSERVGRLLTKRSIAYYLPMHTVVKLVNNKRRKVTEPLLPNLIFVHAEPDVLYDLVVNANPDRLMTYYYNHFKTDSFGKNPPLTIPERSMASFIKVTSSANENVRIISPRYCHFKSGDRVRVMGGEFEGVEGRVARAAGQQRVIVELEGLCLIATAYIPTGLLSTIPSVQASV